MTDWVTAPDALRTIVMLDELRPGDEIQFVYKNEIRRVTLNEGYHVDLARSVFMRESPSELTLVGWRRP